MKKKLPWLLIYFRFLLTLPAILFGYYGLTGAPYIALLAIAALSDVYDGVLARKFNVETAAIRQWDSIADTVFFMGVFVGMCLAFPALVRQYSWGIYGILGLELARYLFDFGKFQRGASYHALSAKVFGVSLLAATISVMGFGVAAPLLPVAMAIGILSELEGLIISIILKEWTYNVKHIGRAIKLRNAA